MKKMYTLHFAMVHFTLKQCKYENPAKDYIQTHIMLLWNSVVKTYARFQITILAIGLKLTAYFNYNICGHVLPKLLIVN